MAKKKDELTRWHADQVSRNVPFHFQHEMIEYCKSDVALLKAGCEAFQQDFERQAGFNPMAKCITIASVCNLYWRKHHLTPDTIAVEPLGGLARGPSQPIPQGPAMAVLPRTPPSQAGGQRRPHSTRPERGRTVRPNHRQQLFCRWVRSPDSHCLRISWVSLPWLSPLLSQPFRQALCSAGPKRGGTLSGHALQTHGPAPGRLHGDRNVGV